MQYGHLSGAAELGVTLWVVEQVLSDLARMGSVCSRV